MERFYCTGHCALHISLNVKFIKNLDVLRLYVIVEVGCSLSREWKSLCKRWWPVRVISFSLCFSNSRLCCRRKELHNGRCNNARANCGGGMLIYVQSYQLSGCFQAFAIKWLLLYCCDEKHTKPYLRYYIFITVPSDWTISILQSRVVDGRLVYQRSLKRWSNKSRAKTSSFKQPVSWLTLSLCLNVELKEHFSTISTCVRHWSKCSELERRGERRITLAWRMRLLNLEFQTYFNGLLSLFNEFPLLSSLVCILVHIFVY